MKPITTFFFTVSLLVNLVLAWFVCTNHASSTQPASVAPSQVSVPKTDTKVAAVDPQTWSNLASPDLPQLMANLRSAGFPPEVIRMILSMQISESFAAQRKAIDPDGANRPFWKTRLPDPRVDSALQQSYRAQQKMLRELLGPEAEDDVLSLINRGQRMEGIPAEKADMIRQIVRDFNDQRQDMYSAGSFTIDREKMAALEKSQRDAIVRVLTPQELEEYDLRNSNTASSLRSSLLAFKPTEEEFRTLFRLRQPFDEKYNLMYGGTFTQELARERMTAERELTEQMKAALGPQRAADYEKTTDNSYRQTSQLVARLELPPETTDQMVSLQKDFIERMRPIMSNRQLDPQQRNAQLAALDDEAKTKITSVLGASGYEAYQQYGGTWMRQLHPRPAPNAARGGAGGGGGSWGFGGAVAPGR